MDRNLAGGRRLFLRNVGARLSRFAERNGYGLLTARDLLAAARFERARLELFHDLMNLAFAGRLSLRCCFRHNRHRAVVPGPEVLFAGFFTRGAGLVAAPGGVAGPGPGMVDLPGVFRVPGAFGVGFGVPGAVGVGAPVPGVPEAGGVDVPGPGVPGELCPNRSAPPRKIPATGVNKNAILVFTISSSGWN